MPDSSTRHANTVTPVGKANCARCEAVCCRLIVVLEPGDDIPPHLTAHTEQGHLVMAHGEDGWCVAVDRTHMNCGIYENRPAVCRRFVMGGPYCKAIRAEYGKPGSRRIAIALK
ncbi:MAG TPA: YkgJ family cysteine cluster protein [Dyella sp.]|nr:YkgJ family cysteine cluster protein [Dyella sp.]